MNAAELLNPDHVGSTATHRIRDPHRECTAAELWSKVVAYDAALRSLGMQPGDRVLILADSSIEWVAACFGIVRGGGVAVPVNPDLPAGPVSYIREHAAPVIEILPSDGALDAGAEGGGGPGAVGGGEPHVERRLQLVPTGAMASSRVELVDDADTCVPASPEQMAMVFYTSGTTGRPKGVVISHGGLEYVATMEADYYEFSPDDVGMVLGSLSFLYPLVLHFLPLFCAGGSAVLVPTFSPTRTLAAMAESSPTTIMGVPTMFEMLLDTASEGLGCFARVRLAVSGGAVLSTSLVDRFADAYGVHLSNIWGLTEMTPLTSTYRGSRSADGVMSCGRAMPGVQLRVVDGAGRDVPAGEVGELVARAPSGMTGYLHEPELTEDAYVDGWLRTGDLGYLDEDGYSYVVGRAKELIIRGGINIYPAEVESAIYAHPQVTEAAVVGVTDRLFGERIRAHVVVTGGLTETDLRTHLADLLPAYKVPEYFRFERELPKGPTGKVLRRVLKENS